MVQLPFGPMVGMHPLKFIFPKNLKANKFAIISIDIYIYIYKGLILYIDYGPEIAQSVYRPTRA
jgi:hypothetical protein